MTGRAARAKQRQRAADRRLRRAAARDALANGTLLRPSEPDEFMFYVAIPLQVHQDFKRAGSEILERTLESAGLQSAIEITETGILVGLHLSAATESQAIDRGLYRLQRAVERSRGIRWTGTPRSLVHVKQVEDLDG